MISSLAVVYTAGGIIHDQGKADVDASIAERITIGLGEYMCAYVCLCICRHT